MRIAQEERKLFQERTAGQGRPGWGQRRIQILRQGWQAQTFLQLASGIREVADL